MKTTTIARLRAVLAPTFPGTGTVLRRMREADLIPAGTGGRDGIGSASINPRHAALALLALAAPCDLCQAPAAAERIGAFRLLCRDETHSSEPAKRTLYDNQTITLLDALAGEIERCDQDRAPSSWDINDRGACQVFYDRLVFGQSLVELPEFDDVVVRSCRIPGRLLADIAALF